MKKAGIVHLRSDLDVFKGIASGILKKIEPLLHIETARRLALFTLNIFAHHSSFRARQDLAHYNSVLVKLVKDHPDRTVNAETVMGIIAVATRAYVMFGNAPSRRQLEDIAIRPVLQMIVSVLRHPEKLQCYNQVYEAFYCISSITQRCRAECRATPGLLPLIAACTRSASFFIRDYSVMAFLGLHADEHEAE